MKWLLQWKKLTSSSPLPIFLPVARVAYILIKQNSQIQYTIINSRPLAEIRSFDLFILYISYFLSSDLHFHIS